MVPFFTVKIDFHNVLKHTVQIFVWSCTVYLTMREEEGKLKLFTISQSTLHERLYIKYSHFSPTEPEIKQVLHYFLRKKTIE